MPVSGGQAARSEGAREVKEDVEGETQLVKPVRSSPEGFLCLCKSSDGNTMHSIGALFPLPVPRPCILLTLHPANIL
jgi:hypothetical protein